MSTGLRRPSVMLKEKVFSGLSGWAMVGVLIAGVAGVIIGVVLIASSEPDPSPGYIFAAAVLVVIDLVCWRGLTVVNPNTARVVMLFGRYHGTVKTPGLRWVNPLTVRRIVSLKVRNF